MRGPGCPVPRPVAASRRQGLLLRGEFAVAAIWLLGREAYRCLPFRALFLPGLAVRLRRAAGCLRCERPRRRRLTMVVRAGPDTVGSGRGPAIGHTL